MPPDLDDDLPVAPGPEDADDLLDLDAIRRGDPRPEDVRMLLDFALPAVLRILGGDNEHDIKDVLAEALKAMFRQGPGRLMRLHTKLHARRLFRRIARFRAYDFLRAEARSREDAYGDPPELPADLEPTLLEARGVEIRLALGLPAGAYLADVLRELIEGAGLEGREPDLLEQHIAGELPQREFAERYEMRPGSVGALTKRVLLKIRRFLGLQSGPLPPWYWGPDREF